MRVTILQDPEKIRVRVQISNPERKFDMPCNDIDQARAYAQGVIDGVKYIHSEFEVPFGYRHEVYEEPKV